MQDAKYTVGWICALPLEMALARAMLDEELARPLHDTNVYTFGRIGNHNVVIACLPAGQTGTNSAANVTSQLRSSFPSIRMGLLVGIGGGAPSKKHDIRLGDVVVSQPSTSSGGVIQYDFGKTVQEGKFVQTGQLNSPPEVLLRGVAKLRAEHSLHGHKLSKYLSEAAEKHPQIRSDCAYQGREHDRLYDPHYDHPNDERDCVNCDTDRLVHRSERNQTIPAVFYGSIASGNQVMRHGRTRERLVETLDVMCFEMEAAGLMNNFPCLVIRGICDYADSHKDKKWQRYAAAVAAAYAKELLYTIPAEQVRETAEVAKNQGMWNIITHDTF